MEAPDSARAGACECETPLAHELHRIREEMPDVLSVFEADVRAMKALEGVARMLRAAEYYQHLSSSEFEPALVRYPLFRAAVVDKAYSMAEGLTRHEARHLPESEKGRAALGAHDALDFFLLKAGPGGYLEGL